MKTKIVYVVVASKDSIYLEQAYVSVWSLKHYNPYAHVTFVMDDRTKEYWDACLYDELKSLVDDIIVKKFENSTSNHYRSRWLKTSLRALVKGDYLFIDTDTVICQPLNEIDEIEADLAMVEDLHFPNVGMHPFKDEIIKTFKTHYGAMLNNNSIYYNSGVIYAKDSFIAYKLYDEWHKVWISSKKKNGVLFDQPPLLKVAIDHPDLIHTMNPNFNVQISASIQYLYTGKILHFFNTNKGIESIHPLFKKDFYNNIKMTGFLTESSKTDIIKYSKAINPLTMILIALASRGYLNWSRKIYLFGLNSSIKLKRFLEQIICRNYKDR